MTAARILHAARTRAAISQRTLAARAGTVASAVSAIERGHREPTYRVLAKLLSRTRHRFVVIPSVRATVAEIGELIRTAVRDGDEALAFRHIIQLSDNLVAEHGLVRGALTIEAPPLTGDDLYDAAVAGVVEYRLGQEGLPAPEWAAAEGRRVSPARILSYGKYTIRVDRSEVPAELLARGVLIDRAALESV